MLWTRCTVVLLVLALFLAGAGTGGDLARASSISLVINGKTIEPDVPPLLKDGRVLVPLRVISEELGAEVDWEHGTRTATVQTGQRKLVLPVQSEEAQLDGETRKLDVPPVVVDGRVLLPVRFVVEELLGAQVEWDQASRGVGTVIVKTSLPLLSGWEVRDEEWGQSIQFQSDRSLNLDVSRGQDASVLQGRLTPVRLDMDEKRVDVDQGIIKRLEFEQVDDKTVGFKLFLDEEYAPYRTRQVSDGVVLELPAEVTDFKHEVGAGREDLVFEMKGPVEPGVHERDGGKTLVLDLPGVRIDKRPGERDVQSHLVRGVEFREGDDGDTQIRVNLHYATSYRWENVDDGLLLELRPVVTGFSYDGDNENGTLSVHTTGPVTAVQESYMASPHRVVLDLEGAILDSEVRDLEVNSSLVTRVRVGQPSRDPDVARLVVDSPGRLNYQRRADTGSREIKLDFQAPSPGDRTVVLDPGHGGRDSGAVGPTGLMEKEVAWAITMHLRSLLQEAGFEVILTRQGDYYVSLEERVRISNNSQADFFVSIHSNAASNRDAGGLETFHERGADAESRRLARLLQEHMVRDLGLRNRGVKEANFYVIHHNRLPAALVEVGFLSNPAEEALLRQEGFRRQAALAIFKGIRDYAEGR